MEYAAGGNLKQVIDEFGCITIPSARYLVSIPFAVTFIFPFRLCLLGLENYDENDDELLLFV